MTPRGRESLSALVRGGAYLRSASGVRARMQRAFRTLFHEISAQSARLITAGPNLYAERVSNGLVGLAAALASGGSLRHRCSGKATSTAMPKIPGGWVCVRPVRPVCHRPGASRADHRQGRRLWSVVRRLAGSRVWVGLSAARWRVRGWSVFDGCAGRLLPVASWSGSGVSRAVCCRLCWWRPCR